MKSKPANIYASTEARWFLPTVWQPAWLDWFKSGSSEAIPAEGHESRPDLYLVLPDNESVGVKLRGSSDPKDLGKLEIKALVTASRPFVLSSGVSGRIDQWVKWSFSDPDKECSTLNGKLLAAGKWIEIKKTRWGRKFSFDAKTCGEVSWDERPNCGCNFELTQIQVAARQRKWISVAFEAFGPPEATPGYLLAVMNQCFGSTNLPAGESLSGLGAMSYPSWLATLT